MDQYAKVLTLQHLLGQGQLQQGQIQMQQQQIKDQQALTAAMHQWDGKDYDTLARGVLQNGGSANAALQLQQHALGLKKTYSDIAKNDAETGEKNLATMKGVNDYMVGQFQAINALPDDQIAGGLVNRAQQLAQTPGPNGKPLIDPQHVQMAQQIAQSGDPATIRQALGLFSKEYMSQSQMMAQAKDEADLAAKKAQLPGQQAESTMKTQEAAMPPMERALRGANALEYYAAKGDPLAQAALQKKIEVAKASRPNVNLMTPNDAKDIADAIENGDQPPTLQGLYRNAGPVRAELARRGVPLAKMETDWKATQKYISTLNGPQQVRMQQAITTASDSLDKIEGLYNEWKQIAPTSGFKVLNKASLIAMKNLPGRAGAVATQLDAQINDLASEIGNVYMGGNSPTDMALKMGATNLQSSWNDQTFAEGLKQTRLNLAIRRNSMIHGMPAGLSGATNYFQGGGQQQNVQQQTPQVGGQPIYANNPPNQAAHCFK